MEFSQIGIEGAVAHFEYRKQPEQARTGFDEAEQNMIVGHIGQSLQRHGHGRAHNFHNFRGADRSDSLRTQFMDQGGKERLDRPRTERFFETAETVDEETLYLSLFDVAQHPIGDFVQELIGRRLPKDSHVAGV